MKRSTFRRLAAACLAATAVAGGLAACTSSSNSTSSSGGGTYTIWDPYPQFDASSAWVQLLTKCQQAGDHRALRRVCPGPGVARGSPRASG